MSKVYVTNYSHEYLEAKEFGELVPVTSGFVDLSSPDRARVEIVKRIIDSDKEDFVLLSGIATVAVMVCLAWFQRHQQIKLLVWERDRETGGNYKVIKITAEGLSDMFADLAKL
jgi:hypothetical protein